MKKKKKEILINDVKYEIIEDHNGFDIDEVKEKLTDYFEPFTYIVGDWAYNKLRLKGFYDSNDKNCTPINNINNLNNYIENSCAYGCRWFQIKKVK